MTTGHHLWRLQRLHRVVEECTATAGGSAAVGEMLAAVGGESLLELGRMLEGCGEITREDGKTYSVGACASAL